MKELEESNDDIDDVLEKVALKRKQQSATRPKRTCTPSIKALEQAALPSASDSVTECDSFDDVSVAIFVSFSTLNYDCMHSKLYFQSVEATELKEGDGGRLFRPRPEQSSSQLSRRRDNRELH